jgi:magnesium-transporting ATPase (P-type)
MNASVERDGHWKTVPAGDLVPGDVVKLTLGGVVAADVKITGGEVQLDQSMLTGESVPIEAGAGIATFAGALVRRGEATAEVTATGPRTKFGRTAELVRTAHVVSSQQKAVLRVVRNLAAFNGLVILTLIAYAYFLKMPFAEIIPLVLTAILASIPVALPATFTLAASLGARSLAKRGVLPTRLSAVDEAGRPCRASMRHMFSLSLHLRAPRAARIPSMVRFGPRLLRHRCPTPPSWSSTSRLIRRKKCRKRVRQIRAGPRNESLRAPLPSSSG